MTADHARKIVEAHEKREAAYSDLANSVYAGAEDSAIAVFGDAYAAAREDFKTVVSTTDTVAPPGAPPAA